MKRFIWSRSGRLAVSALIFFAVTGVSSGSDSGMGAVYKADEVARAPELPGGKEALKAFFKENVSYPRRDLMMNKTGRVHLRCVIDKEGHVRDLEVSYTEEVKRNAAEGRVEGTGRRIERPNLEAEALRVAKLLPRFKPGQDDKGNSVNVELPIPITFFAAGQ